MGGWRWARACLGPALSVASIAWGQSPAVVELPPVDVPVPAAPPPPESPLVRDPTGLTTVVDVASRRSEVSTLGVLVGEAPGVVLQQTGGIGQAEQLSLRGASSTGVLVLLDGVPLNALGGVADLSLVPLPAVQRAEVLRGGAGAALRGRRSRGRGQPRHPERRGAGHHGRRRSGQLRDDPGQRERLGTGARRLGPARAARRAHRRRLHLPLRPARRHAGQQSEDAGPGEQPGHVGRLGWPRRGGRVGPWRLDGLVQVSALSRGLAGTVDASHSGRAPGLPRAPGRAAAVAGLRLGRGHLVPPRRAARGQHLPGWRLLRATPGGGRHRSAGTGRCRVGNHWLSASASVGLSFADADAHAPRWAVTLGLGAGRVAARRREASRSCRRFASTRRGPSWASLPSSASPGRCRAASRCRRTWASPTGSPRFSSCTSPPARARQSGAPARARRLRRRRRGHRRRPGDAPGGRLRRAVREPHRLRVPATLPHPAENVGAVRAAGLEAEGRLQPARWVELTRELRAAVHREHPRHPGLLPEGGALPPTPPRYVASRRSGRSASGSTAPCAPSPSCG